jgi:3-deoxy-7-phosphoheptulonate synthase
MELADKDLSFNYRTHCDPRLNYEQSLGGSPETREIRRIQGIADASIPPPSPTDVAFLIADHLKAKRRGTPPRDVLLSELRGRSSTRSD